MAEVEAQAVGRHERALLGHVIAEHLAQRLVQQMGRRVVGADGRAALVIDDQLQRLVELQRAVLHRDVMDEEIAELLLGAGDAHPRALALHHAGIADLAAGFAVERRLVEDHEAGLAGLELRDFLCRPSAAPATTPSAVSVS